MLYEKVEDQEGKSILENITHMIEPSQ